MFESGHVPEKGFTLIELLIVVAIIAILAAIAVPSFLEAQVRSKISRVKADHRSLATAIESYRVDSNRYPEYSDLKTTVETLSVITTPISYMTSIPKDPFKQNKFYAVLGATDPGTFYPFYMDKIGIVKWNGGSDSNWLVRMPPGQENALWNLTSPGPDGDTYVLQGNFLDPNFQTIDWYYDPTNGTVSLGDIMRFGP